MKSKRTPPPTPKRKLPPPPIKKLQTSNLSQSLNELNSSKETNEQQNQFTVVSPRKKTK